MKAVWAVLFAVFLVVVSVVVSAVGQSVPERLNYQGRILENDRPFTGTTNIVVSLYDAPADGIRLYAETQTVSAVEGFYSLQVGAISAAGLANALTNPAVYLETTVGATVLSPRERVVSSAYAIRAKIAESAPNALPLTGGTLSGALNMNGNYITNVHSIDISQFNVQIGEGALSYSCSSGSVAVGRAATSRYRIGGVAIGCDADGDYNGIGIGYQADGQYSNIAIGFASSAYSGYDRIAIGRDITNRRNNTCAIRGTLYLDGGTGVLYRSTVGTGSWTPKAFTIPHPLDPENKVLRHYCLEGPDVWNVYAGNAVLKNGEATVELPDYYGKLNLTGSEVYTLTPVGMPSAVYVKEEVKDNRFVIAGTPDTKVSWCIKVQRNDPGCLEGLEYYPVEQSAAEVAGHRDWLEAQQYLNLNE